jgi:hypothetical protein
MHVNSKLNPQIKKTPRDDESNPITNVEIDRIEPNQIEPNPNQPNRIIDIVEIDERSRFIPASVCQCWSMFLVSEKVWYVERGRRDGRHFYLS